MRFAVLLLGLLCACAEPPESDSRPGRIILFVMDTVRADRVSGFAQLDTAPTLSEIAEEGVRFPEFYAASSYTIPSLAALFTGRHPASPAARMQGPERAPTLVELFLEAGWRTQGFHEGGFASARYGFHRGFEEYRSHEELGVVDAALPEIVEWIREASDERYLLFLHTYAAHKPYGGHERYRREQPDRGLLTPEQIAPLRSATPEALASLPDEVRLTCTLYNFLRPPGERLLGCGERRLSGDFPQTPEFERDRAALLHSYDERIGLIDRAIARIRDELVALGQWDDTLLILTSDHGEAFFEHGLVEHGYVPFDEVLRIPLVVSYPKLLREGPVREVSGLTWHLDLAPSILRLAGIDPPPSLSGIDLVPMMLGSAVITERRTLFPLVLDFPMDPGEPRLVVLRGPLKYVEGHERFGDAGGFLFDRRADPHERRNLRELRPRQFQSLVAASHRFRARLAPTAIPLIEPLEFSEQERRRLRALGYLD